MKIDYKKIKKTPIDSPERTLHHALIIQNKPILFKIYQDWYQKLISETETSSLQSEKILELGSGGGIAKKLFPQIITSDVISDLNCDITCSAYKLPFEDNELFAIIMIDVFHHLDTCELFLDEAYRVLKKNGKIVMIEPSNGVWARFIYKNFHHELFDEKQSGWNFKTSGPLSGSNMALPYIVFDRDATLFKQKYPNFKIKKFAYHSPLSYLLSGGLSMKNIVPNSFYKLILGIEKVLECKNFSMFKTIVIQKK